jgi:hypothetical protein
LLPSPFLRALGERSKLEVFPDRHRGKKPASFRNESNTTLDGYSTSLGAPEGRYIAPANYGTCVQVRAGDCAPRSVLLLSPWFQRFDLGIAKKVGIGGTKNFEVRFDWLNVLDNPNYNPAANPGSERDDLSHDERLHRCGNTYDPGGRIGQLMIR